MIYKFYFRKIDSTGPLKALVNIELDKSFVVEGLKIIEDEKGKLSISFPSINKSPFGQICLLGDMKDVITEQLLSDYHSIKNEAIYEIRGDLNYKVKCHFVGYEKLRAYVDLDIGFIHVPGIKVIKKKDNSLFIAMPSKKTNRFDKDGKPIYMYFAKPCNTDFYDELYRNIVSVYDKLVLSTPQSELEALQKSYDELQADITASIENINQLAEQMYDDDYSVNDEKNAMIGIEYMLNYSRAKDISLIQERITAIKNEIRSAGGISEDMKSYDKLYKDIQNFTVAGAEYKKNAKK